MGIYPMKGKPLNVRNAHRLKISVNQEIVDLKGTLGLRQGVDYTIPENFKTLRYGQLIIMADADDDGKHIVGLILNFFHRYYKSLLTLNYIKFIRTPIMKGHKGKNTVKFYTQHEHDLWAKGKDLKGWRFEYYKGLGSSSKKEIQEDMIPTPRMVTFDCDDPIASQSMELAFNKKFADLRKEWIRTWEPDYSIEDLQVLPISDFINHEFIQFSISDLKRSLPRLMDGMKVSQRKVIWGQC
jgi:DNA topoisomerase-2